MPVKSLNSLPGAPDRPGRRAVAAFLLGLVAAALCLAGAGALYLWLAPAPVTVGPFVVLGPRCTQVPAGRGSIPWKLAGPGVRRVSFSANGRVLLTESAGTARMWATGGGAPVLFVSGQMVWQGGGFVVIRR